MRAGAIGVLFVTESAYLVHCVAVRDFEAGIMTVSKSSWVVAGVFCLLSSWGCSGSTSKNGDSSSVGGSGVAGSANAGGLTGASGGARGSGAGAGASGAQPAGGGASSAAGDGVGGGAGSPDGAGGGSGGAAGSVAEVCAPPTVTLAGSDAVVGELIQFNDNGSWTWFSDERVVVDAAHGKLVIGSVASG